jgi:DNA uptake protein ComE-like DNA-binding protein
MADSIRIQMMDHFMIYIDEKKTDHLVSKSKKGAALVQYLILNEGQPVPNQKLLSTLWDEEKSQNPENALKTLVSRLRVLMNQIDPSLGACIVSDRGAYHWECTDGMTIDLSQADTAQLKRVPGIGSHFARAIVHYRQRLGGYVSIDQLSEIDGFPAEAKSYFTIGHDSVVRLNLNHLSVNELRRHPYLNYYQARTIVDYRRQHGPLKSLDDLRLLRDFPAETLQRLQPYVEF